MLLAGRLHRGRAVSMAANSEDAREHVRLPGRPHHRAVCGGVDHGDVKVVVGLVKLTGNVFPGKATPRGLLLGCEVRHP